jgi:hypothetical protein
MATEIYAAHLDNVLKMAARKEGVSRPQIIKDLNVSRPVANDLIKRAGLTLDRKEGKTEFFVKSAAPETPEQQEQRKAVAASVKQSKPTVEPSTVEPPVLEEPEIHSSAPELPPEVKASAVPETTDTDMEPDLDKIAKLDAEIINVRNSLRAAATKVGKAAGEWVLHQTLFDELQIKLKDLANKRMKLSL